MTLPAPGLYEDVPAEQYHAWPACSSSRLRHIGRSPAYAKWCADNPKPSTPAMLRGTTIHSAVLEPHLFHTQYASWSGPSRNTKAGKEAWAEFQAENESKTIVPVVDYDIARKVSDAAWAHPVASVLLADARRELSGVWMEDGTPCKFRADAVDDGSTLVDLKTTARVGSVGEIERWLVNNGTHIQSAHYKRGLNACDVPVSEAIVIVANTESPHEVAVVRLTPDLLRCGEERRRRRMATYAECLQSGLWPAWPTDVIDADAPHWEQVACFPEEFAPAPALTMGGKPMEL